MPGTKTCTSDWAASRCCRKAASNASGTAVIAGPAGGPPVLLIRIWTGLPAATSAATASRAVVSSMSAVRQPCCWSACLRGNCSTSSFSASADRASTVTFAPSSASSMAVARPIPCDAPQTKAWRPVRSSCMKDSSPWVSARGPLQRQGAEPAYPCEPWSVSPNPSPLGDGVIFERGQHGRTQRQLQAHPYPHDTDFAAALGHGNDAPLVRMADAQQRSNTHLRDKVQQKEDHAHQQQRQVDADHGLVLPPLLALDEDELSLVLAELLLESDHNGTGMTSRNVLSTPSPAGALPQTALSTALA